MSHSTTRRLAVWTKALLFLTGVALATLAPVAHAQKKDNKAKQEAAQLQPPPKPKVDTSKLVWPSPPDMVRIKWLAQVSSQDDLTPPAPKKEKKKRSWMDRLAGVSLPNEVEKRPLALSKQFGVAADSKGRIYAADTARAQVFVFDLENKRVEFLTAEFATARSYTTWRTAISTR